MPEIYRQGTPFNEGVKPGEVMQIDLHKGGESLKPLWVVEWEKKAAEVVAATQPVSIKPEVLSPSQRMMQEVVNSGLGMKELHEDATKHGIGVTPKVVMFPSKMAQAQESMDMAA